MRMNARSTLRPSSTRKPSTQRRALRLLGVVLALLLLVAAALLLYSLRRPALVLGQDAVYQGSQARAVWSEQDGGVIDIMPLSGPADTLLVIYPGGLVRPQAYQWLGTALAASGVETVIVRFPADLAVTGIGRAEAVIARYARGRPVYLAGHSLGGAMAAQHVSGPHGAKINGLILMGAYPAGNVSLASQTKLRVLDLLAEHDQVASAANVQDGLKRLPDSTKLVTIRGSVHSFFGRYGPQRGDGQPTVTRADAEAQIVKAIEGFVLEQ